MNAKESKKLRQLQRREARDQWAAIDERTTNLIKLPPKWFPSTRLWFWLQGLFLNI